MRKLENFHLLVMLILLVAVGQMAQTIYVPSIADMARDLGVRSGAVQGVMAAYLLTYGGSQLIYGPISDRVGRRPVILAGMGIHWCAVGVAIDQFRYVGYGKRVTRYGNRRSRCDGSYYAARPL